jgi:hypothetical protein
VSKRDQILSAVDIKTEEMEIPEWGTTVTIRGLTGKQRASYFEDQQQENQPLWKFVSKLVVLGVVDEDGDPIFTEDDLEAIGEKNADVLDRIAAAVGRLSGFGPDSKGETEEMAQQFR